MAYSLGLLGIEEPERTDRLLSLKETGVLEGEWYDVDDVLFDNPPWNPPLGPFPSLKVGEGVSAMRFADVEGYHQWIGGYEKNGFKYGKHTLRQVSIYHRCSGRLVFDEDPLCLQAEECALLDHIYLKKECRFEEQNKE